VRSNGNSIEWGNQARQKIYRGARVPVRSPLKRGRDGGSGVPGRAGPGAAYGGIGLQPGRD